MATNTNLNLFRQVFDYTPAELKAKIKAAPEYQQALTTHAPTEFQIGAYRIRVNANGGVDARRGTAPWKPLLAAGLVAAGGYGLSLIPSVAPAAAGTTAATGTTTAGSLVAAGAPAATATTVAPVATTAGSGFGLGTVVRLGAGPVLNAATNIYATRAQVKASDRAAVLQSEAAKQQLDYLKGVEATRRSEWEKTQALNLDQYNQYQQRLEPWRRVGTEAVTRVGDLIRPGSGASYLPPPTQYLPARSLVRA